MRKQIALGLIFVFMFTFSGIAFAAETNPFTSVPVSHWAYKAIENLVKAGLIDGYGDGDFRGDKPVSRYEMAVLVAKAMSNVNKADAVNKAALDRLEAEFAGELQNLGVRVANLEKNASSFKWWGDARIRYQANPNNTATDNSLMNETRFQERIRLGLYADIAPNLSVLGRLKAENTNHHKDTWDNNIDDEYGDNHSKMYIDLLGLNWNNGPLSASFGRIPVSIGQGIIWNDNPVDGIYTTYKFDKVVLSAGYGDLGAENWSNYAMDAFLANVVVNVSSKTNITLGHLKTSDNNNTLSLNHDDYHNNTWKAPYKLDQTAYGFSTQLQDNLKLLAEGVRNSASGLPDNAQRNGWWSRLTYGNQDWQKEGTYQIYLDYMKLGNWAVDSTAWGHILNVAGGDGLGNDGEKGWGLGVSYMLAKQTNLDVNYYKLKPYDSNAAGFSDYKDTYNISLNFSF
ncbi:Hypothetical protein LUCI_5157 [Lucifera butyrica]|uniref:SLH domain-containing protein n=1 Tax=Lucifera butyrica TaxID=1351585 RepID=A0A498REW2_9FIRM|nr:S-layer homology domain-containing protein [Lucifera butyrica]VBB09859.1 Hypothetical protein LUCI_5157 [Lucifera butyrica]